METWETYSKPILAKEHIDAAEAGPASDTEYADATTPSTIQKEPQGECFLQWIKNMDTLLYDLSVIREQVKAYREQAHGTPLKNFSLGSVIANLKTLYGPQNQISQVLVVVETIQGSFVMMEAMGFKGCVEAGYNLAVVHGCLARYIDTRNMSHRSLLGGQNELNTALVTVEETETLVQDMKDQLKGGALKELLVLHKDLKKENERKDMEIETLKKQLRKALDEGTADSDEAGDIHTPEALEDWEENVLAHLLLLLAGVVFLVLLPGVIDRANNTEDLRGGIEHRNVHSRYPPFNYYGAMTVSEYDDEEEENGTEPFKKMMFEGAGGREGLQMPLI
ncbi:uncharacterized protein BDZ99DRAFT_519960 [Mytilinidion resinicola]|uniref:Uncharacterized protein n=1 Tax=Mytilinidion resinicola TaxID=574789 RepID=A0A6A6YLV9_9PEZI|nr:uncharacterized protein BDZ99DRAFT_519960 [Mytilinidion resinicola]KAF2809862.1 hypothetical protein BDZ99DRAFT_519960 [Mytilinidion resinicola]